MNRVNMSSLDFSSRPSNARLILSDLDLLHFHLYFEPVHYFDSQDASHNLGEGGHLLGVLAVEANDGLHVLWAHFADDVAFCCYFGGRSEGTCVVLPDLLHLLDLDLPILFCLPVPVKGKRVRST